MTSLDGQWWTESDDDSSIEPEAVIEDWVKHPVSELWAEWKSSNKKQKSNFDFEAHKERFTSYLQELAAEPHCLDVFTNGREMACTCMKDLNMEDDQVARVVAALMKFATKTKLERDNMVAEWIRYAEAHQKNGGGLMVYLLPGGNQLICQHALARVCGMKARAWKSLRKKVREGKSLEHGLAGRAGNRQNDAGRDLIDAFLSRLEEQGAPRATRLVRYLNKDGNLVQETWDDDLDVIDLPSSCTRLGLYKQFIAELGWRYVYDPKNRIIDKVAIEGMEKDASDEIELPSIRTFLRHWEQFFPKMRIQRHAADICDECFVFANQVRYKQRLTGKEG
jgi:hypothetical protein